ncbi:MAG TPA: SLC13 family permease [Caulobacteraceae bacterium]|nr:SLC13 family permease [Caulobacteraceae bacterium]
MSEPGRAIVAVVVIAAVAGVILRPFRTREAVWAVAGAALLVVTGLLPIPNALAGLAKSLDVCLFLVGMMLLAETARREGLFDAVAAFAVNHAAGSPGALFALVYGAGVVVTVFLSNDATAVVLTPAVFAAARRARTEPLPHLFACAMVANAASFVLPISNPANLVLYASRPPPLADWLGAFALASALSIAATYIALRWTERRALAGHCEPAVAQPALTRGGWAAIAGLAVAVVVLLTVSATGQPLGAPTAIVGALVAALPLLARRASPLPLLRGISWQILPLVAALFVMVEAVDRIGAAAAFAGILQRGVAAQPQLTAWASGGGVALATNLANNLPVGLLASQAAALAAAPRRLVDALMIGVDLGPNLSVTGSLATILWLTVIRREGENVTAWRFLKTGLVVMPPALILALAARLAVP